MQPYKKIECVTVCFLTTILFVGCGSKNPLNRQSVSGTVTLNGQPVESGSIEFQPQGAKGTMSGAVIADGKYSIATAQGLPPGNYTVRIYSADETAEREEVPGESNKLAVEKIPAKYNTESTLTKSVEAGKDNVFDFEILAE
ncbi:carboxypeptidase-like regulatory domain-containing protein [Thalassoglobus sp.]|uniref:carboxypeptidase-like regulatory domain-containing protein n=1 Tax=Thalassoglobus sp. TaxID=2795869 RepID=UPI003AA8952E